MGNHVLPLVLCLIVLSVSISDAAWWNPQWRYKTTVSRATPWRDAVATARPAEVAIDLPLLLERAGVAGEFDPASVRVIDPRTGEQVPSALRTEWDPRRLREQAYLTWWATPAVGEVGSYEIYFDTTDRSISAQEYRDLPPEDIVTNGGFEEAEGDLPAGWSVSSPTLASLDRSGRTVGERSLRLHADAATDADTPKDVAVSQTVDVAAFAGQEFLFECELYPERGKYGTPMTVQLVQFRDDGSRIPGYAIQPRWMTVQMAEGQRVQFAERGRLSHEAATVEIIIRTKLYANDAWDGTPLTDEEKEYTCWLDGVTLRPGERWPWPGASEGCYVEGALEGAPLNRAIDFSGDRRLLFDGASEGTTTGGDYNPDPRSVHWGPERGTLEMWVQPHWSSAEDADHMLFYAKAYLHRRHSQLRVVGGEDAALEFSISDADRHYHTVRGPVQFEAGSWHHIAATWDLPRAHLQLFVDGQLLAVEGPGEEPWASTMDPRDPKIELGQGTSVTDRRSIPMQAFVGGDSSSRAAGAANAIFDELRVSDVVRYEANFEPLRTEFAVDEDTRALFHFEREKNGTHSRDDRFVEGFLVCEQHPMAESAPLHVNRDGQIEERMVAVAPHASEELYQQNSPQTVLTVTRPVRDLPDPRFVEARVRSISRTVSGDEAPFDLQVGGDLKPLMLWSRFRRADGAGAATTLIPRWRANDNVVPFSWAALQETLAPNAQTDQERALEIFRYALKTTNYYDAPYCETLGTRHRDRVSYTLIRALNTYPFDQCGPLNHTLRYLFLAGGISSNNSPGTHHQFGQCFYDGSLRLYDLSPRQYWLDRDNENVISLRRLTEDPWLKIRQQGDVNAWIPGMVSSASYGSVSKSPSIDVPLRPGESVSFGWHNEGQWMALGKDREPIHPAKIPPSYGNGGLIYRPVSDGEAAEITNLAVADGGLTPVDPAQAGSLIYRVRLPYVLAGGTVTMQHDGGVTLSLSGDEEQSWTELRSTDGEGTISIELGEAVMNRYDYSLRIETAPGASVSGLEVRSVFCVSPLSLPGELAAGDNVMQFVAGPVTEPVEAELAWLERYHSDLGVSLNSLSFYLMDDENHRNLYVARPGEELAVEVTLEGRAFSGEVALEGLPEGWLAGPASAEVTGDGTPTTASFTLTAAGAEGETVPFEVVVREDERERRLQAQVLVVSAAAVVEAEQVELSGGAEVTAEPAESGGAYVSCPAEGAIAFTAETAAGGKHALWVRLRVDSGGSSRIHLRVGDEDREVRINPMIGFSDWESADRASSKVFAHYGEERDHWSWWRVPDIELARGAQTVEIACGAGQSVDALMLLPQTQEVDRAAMNLLHTWNFAPWLLPM
jgi:hypothetical protein